MRSNKAGLADLKRLHQVAKAAARTEAEHTRVAEKEAPAPHPGDSETFQRVVRTVQPLKPVARVVHARAQEPAAVRTVARRAAATGEAPIRADQGVSDGDLSHMLSENGTAFVRADVAPAPNSIFMDCGWSRRATRFSRLSANVALKVFDACASFMARAMARAI